MEQSGGQIAAKRAKPPDGGEDRLSALHDDQLLRILVLLDTTEAARTSVLARRWKSLWRCLPEVRFNPAPDGNRISDVLDAPDDAPVLQSISVTTKAAAPDTVATWLPAAARRLVGDLLYRNVDPKSTGKEEDDDDDEELEAGEIRGLVELPCFQKATKIELKLRYQGLTFPSQGVFGRLTNLFLRRVRFHGPCNVGDAVSEARCPCLQKLILLESHGLDTLSIHSKSLLKIKLLGLGMSLKQLTIVAPNLKKLALAYSLFDDDQTKPVANISAPQIVYLVWADAYDPESVRLGNLGQLEYLRTKLFWVYEPGLNREQNQCLRFLHRFKAVHSLSLILVNQPDVHDYQYLTGNITVLPQIMFLRLDLLNYGHAFGASVFHVLRMCSGLRRFVLVFFAHSKMQAQIDCPTGCICDEQENWKTEEVLLKHLQEVEIIELRGSQYEVSFVKQVFDWAKDLKRLKITFSSSMSKSNARILRQVFRSFSRPEICMEFYM